ncbi:MAG: sugar transferase [Firmicutes bacterium]|nr:sugar transferase [Bacillota bacterium]
MSFGKKYLKRPFDIVLSLVLIVLLSPILVLTAIAIVCTSRGPILFNQKRIGMHLTIFTLYKFRSFIKPTPFDIDNPVITRNNNSVTFVGKIIRRLKIDELPQLFNILKGEMSFVGPRPFVDTYLQRYQGWEYAKFAVRPGLTGLSQTNGNGHLSREERSYYDIIYTSKGWLYDFVIMFKSIFVVLLDEKKFYKTVSQQQLDSVNNWTMPKNWQLINYNEVRKQKDKQLILYLDYIKYIEQKWKNQISY